MTAPENRSTNLLLARLGEEDAAFLRPHMERLPLERGQVLVAANEPVTHVWFPHGGVASIVAPTRDHGLTEIGIFGREGMSGSSVLLGVDRSPHETFIQVDGSEGTRVPVPALLDACERSAGLRGVLLHFVQCLMVQVASSAASNAHQRMEARLARWLLMCHDRGDGDEIALTHEFMGMMIAAERSGVTVSLHVLEGVGAIRSRRGRVVVRDRALLEDLAGDGYGQAENEYRRLLGRFDRRVTEYAPGPVDMV